MVQLLGVLVEEMAEDWPGEQTDEPEQVPVEVVLDVALKVLVELGWSDKCCT